MMPVFAIDRKQTLRSILHDLHMLMAKADFDNVCRPPQLPLFGYLFLLATEPTGTALFLIIRIIVFRIAIPANHEIGFIIGENHGLHRS